MSGEAVKPAYDTSLNHVPSSYRQAVKLLGRSRPGAWYMNQIPPIIGFQHHHAKGMAQ